MFWAIFVVNVLFARCRRASSGDTLSPELTDEALVSSELDRSERGDELRTSMWLELLLREDEELAEELDEFLAGRRWWCGCRYLFSRRFSWSWLGAKCLRPVTGELDLKRLADDW